MVKVNGYEVPEGLYYSGDYAWVRVEDERVRVGITDYAQKQLREIVYVDLPSPGATISKGEPYGTVESVKAVSDLIAPVSGSVEEVNEEAKKRPEIINEDSYGKGWLIVVRPTKLEEELKALMTTEQAVKWHKSLIEKA